MANRIYIAIGLLAIMLLGAAFIVPWLVDWNSYKPRMEEMTAEALGIEVAIEGDMAFTLLPQPRMRIEGVRLGPATRPLGEAQLVEADFSLMDFLRDRFTVTQLRLVAPHINLTIDEDGHLETPITLAETANASNVSVAQARFEDGIFTVTDMRNGESRALSGFYGDMRMTGLRGPFAMQGTGEFEGTEYSGRFSTSAMNEVGQMTITAFMRPVAGNYSISLDGLLKTGGSPSFEGQGVYRQLEQGGGVVGDLVLTSPVVATTSEVLLNGFTLLPDENHAATRMTGTASVALGARPQFNAVISGGVVTLLPRVIADDAAVEPFDIVRLLREMPQPMLPPLPGRIGVDINELGLRGIAVRDVRLDAVTNGELWRIEEFSGRLAGDTSVRLVGTLGRQAGWPAFAGTLDISARRLDALSLLWRRTVDGNPLFNMPGQLTGEIRMTNDGLRLNDGLFVLDGTNHSVSGLMRFGEQPTLEVAAELSELSPGQSSALLALLPPIDPVGQFGVSFPTGRLDLQAAGGRVGGQNFANVSLAMSWNANGIALEGARIGDYGGLGFEGSGQLSGTLTEPVIFGSGQLSVARNASALAPLLGTAQANPMRALIAGSLPAEVFIRLDAPERDGSQALTMEGVAGEADIWLSAEISDGLSKLGQGRVALTLEAQADSGTVLTQQLGVAPIIAGEDGAILTLSIDGNPATSLETELTLEGGGERIDFTGTLMTSDLSALSGQGLTSFLFEDSSALAELAGVDGIWLPGLEGQAEIGFIGGNSVTVGNLTGYAGERSFAGEMTYARQSNSALLSGSLHFDALDLETLAAMLGGPAATMRADPGAWAHGPLDIGQSARSTRGRISIDAPVLMSGDAVLLEALAFDYAWDAEDVRFRGLMGEIGGGTLELEAALCCSSVLAEKSLNGRFSVNGVDVDALLQGTGAQVIDGVVTLGGQFQANGQSYRDLVGSLTGAGSIAVSDLRVERTSPGVFQRAAEIENIIALEPEVLEGVVIEALNDGPFEADDAAGLFSLVGGTARVSNLAVEGDGARLIGGGGLRLADLHLDSNWTLALTRPVGGNELITETTGRVGIGLRGPLSAPERTLDLTQMVDALQMRAYEIELNELERLRAEQEARQRAQAEEQARRIEDEARRQAEELLRQQEEEAARLAEEQRHTLLEDIRRQLDERARSQEAQPVPVPQPTPAPTSTPSIQQIPPGALQLDVITPR